jgi:hypothetical protein
VYKKQQLIVDYNYFMYIQDENKLNNIYTKRFQWHANTYVGQKLKKNAHYIFYLHIFISWKKKGGGAVH